MSALSDAKRYLWLEGLVTDEQPIDHLKAVVSECSVRQPSLKTQLESRIAELEAKLKEANDRTRAVEHQNVQLEEQLKGNRLFQRVKDLEFEVKKANERTRLVEHKLVVANEKRLRNKRP